MFSSEQTENGSGSIHSLLRKFAVSKKKRGFQDVEYSDLSVDVQTLFERMALRAAEHGANYITKQVEMLERVRNGDVSTCVDLSGLVRRPRKETRRKPCPSDEQGQLVQIFPHPQGFQQFFSLSGGTVARAQCPSSLRKIEYSSALSVPVFSAVTKASPYFPVNDAFSQFGRMANPLSE